jgi:hypothetical protein
VPTATPSYYPCLRRPPRGWRRLAFECGAIFSVLLYTGDTSGRRCVTALQSYTAKKRIHLLFSSAKKRYTALMYPVGRSGRSQALRISPRRVLHDDGSRFRWAWISVSEMRSGRVLRLRLREIKPAVSKSISA